MTQHELQERLRRSGPVIVELGCGPNPSPDVIGIDSLPLPGVALVADLEAGLPFLPTASVDEVRSRHFLEHIEAFEQLMADIHRVLKPGGRHVCVVPHFSNPYYYSDPTHRRFFGLYTFDYFSRPEHQLRRKVPPFYFPFRFRVVERVLVFRSPFPVYQAFCRVVQRLVNVSDRTREFYERHFCYRFPCQEIRFVMVPEPPDA